MRVTQRPNSDEIHGRLFFHDGTAVYKEIKVEVEFRSGLGIESNRAEAECDDSGKFSLQLPQAVGSLKHVGLRFYVQGDEISKERVFFTPSAEVMLVMPQKLGAGRGDEGGLITGKVLDEDGSPVEKAKVEAKVVSSSLFKALSPTFAETKTDKYGRFALAFEGGAAVKGLTVDGHRPVRSTRKTSGDQEDEQVDAGMLEAGAFNLRLVRERKFLGLW